VPFSVLARRVFLGFLDLFSGMVASTRGIRGRRGENCCVLPVLFVLVRGVMRDRGCSIWQGMRGRLGIAHKGLASFVLFAVFPLSFSQVFLGLFSFLGAVLRDSPEGTLGGMPRETPRAGIS